MVPKRLCLALCLLVSLLVLSIVLCWGRLDHCVYSRVKPIMLDTSGCYNPNLTHLERRKAAVLGAFVADAATMPLHWYAGCQYAV